MNDCFALIHTKFNFIGSIDDVIVFLRPKTSSSSTPRPVFREMKFFYFLYIMRLIHNKYNPKRGRIVMSISINLQQT